MLCTLFYNSIPRPVNLRITWQQHSKCSTDRRSRFCSCCSASLQCIQVEGGGGEWQWVLNHGDRFDRCRSKKLKLWDKAPHPGHLGDSFFSLALLVGVAALAARAWSAACQSAQALYLLLGGQYLLATIWLQQKETERRISCKATVKILFSSMPWWEICWLTLLFPQVIIVTGLNRYTCIHSAPIISPLSCSKQRDASLFDALKSCIIQGSRIKALLFLCMFCGARGFFCFVFFPYLFGTRRLSVELREMGFALMEMFWKSCQACWIELVRKGGLFAPLQEANSITPR